MNDELVECAFNQQAKRSNCVAYCENHKCYLTILHLKNMKCLQKQCNYLKKEMTHKYWINRAEKKKRKKLNK
jgi:hypothetical protein